MRCPEWEGGDVLLDSIEFVQTPVIPLEGATGTGSIYPPTPSHKVDNQPPQSSRERTPLWRHSINLLLAEKVLTCT